MNIVNIKDLKNELHKLFPHGHPKFLELVWEELGLHSLKNHDYAKGGDPLGNFKRVALILQNYPDLKITPATVAIIYFLKQLDASLWMLSNATEAKVEGHFERWRDIAIYAKIIAILIEPNSINTMNEGKYAD